MRSFGSVLVLLLVLVVAHHGVFHVFRRFLHHVAKAALLLVVIFVFCHGRGYPLSESVAGIAKPLLCCARGRRLIPLSAGMRRHFPENVVQLN